MTIERLHQEFKLRWNKLNSNHKKDFPTAYLDDIFNKVIDDYVETFYSGNNSKQYKFGFEVNQQRVDMLQTLIVPETEYMATFVELDRYRISLLSFSPTYRHFLRAYVVPIECATKRIPITTVRSNDLDVKLRDANTQPSLLWERCLGSIKNNFLEFYTKGYTTTSAKVEYLRNPVKVFSGGYDSLEFTNGDLSAYSSVSSTVTSDISESYHDLLVDLAVQYAASILEDNNKFQLQKEQILNKV